MDLVLAGIKPLSIFASREKNEVGRLLNSCRNSVGCRHVGHVLVRRAKGRPETFVSVTYPGKWLINYGLRSYFSIDPVVNHAEITTRPIILDDLTSSDRRVKDMLTDARRFGIGRSFVSFSIMPSSDLPGSVMFSFDIEPAEFASFFRKNEERLQRAARQIHLDILSVRGLTSNMRMSTDLDERERRCLEALANGHSFGEISLMLDTGPELIADMMSRILEKLDCGNSMQAVSRALSLGLLDESDPMPPGGGLRSLPGVGQTRH